MLKANLHRNPADTSTTAITIPRADAKIPGFHSVMVDHLGSPSVAKRFAAWKASSFDVLFRIN
jgi:hypothetical protein